MTILTPEQSRAARGLLSWSQTDLSFRSEVSSKAIWDFEAGTRSPREDTLKRIQAAFEKAGVEFIPENGGGVGVRLKKAKKRRA